MPQDILSRSFLALGEDDLAVDVDGLTPLYAISTFPSPSKQALVIPTKVIGVSFKIFARSLFTTSASPEIHTFVTKPVRLARCSPGTGFGLLLVTVACTLSPLPSLICRQRLRRISTCRVCTGRAWFGVSSAAPSVCVHF